MKRYTAIGTYQAFGCKGEVLSDDDLPIVNDEQSVFDTVEEALSDFVARAIPSHLDEDDTIVPSVGVLLDSETREKLGYIVTSINHACDIDPVVVGHLLSRQDQVAAEIRRDIDRDSDVFSIFAKSIIPEEDRVISPGA